MMNLCGEKTWRVEGATRVSEHPRLCNDPSSSVLPADPFLPVRTDFHPKRNQARQKLATLPKNRFKDLASDVFYELNRRFPDFQRDVAPELSAPAFPQSVVSLRRCRAFT